MNKKRLKVLLIEDNKYDIKAFERLVIHQNLPYDYTIVHSLSETRRKLKTTSFDVIVADFHLEDGTLSEILDMLKHIPLIVTTGAGDEDIAVAVIKEGAYEYLSKDIRGNYLKILPVTIDSAIRHKKIEKKIQMLSKAIMSINEGVYVTDMTDRIIFVNHAFCEIYGYEEKKILGSHCGVLWQDDSECKKIKNSLIKAGNSGQKRECIHKKSNSDEFTIFLSSSLVKDENGEVVAVVNIVSDITKRKKEEQELRKAKKAAETANLAKSEFLARMSHEIRTPLNSIIGMTELLMDTDLEPEQQEYLNVVNSSSEALLGLVNELLDFSMLEAKQIQLININFNLIEIIQNVGEILSFCAKEKGLELIYTIDANVPAWVVGDPGRLRQVLVNLTSNGIKFTSEGSVSINVKRTTTSNENDPDKIGLHFTVSDTGIGIAPHKIERMFQKFSQADTSTTRRFGGSGLGLSIARTLVRLMGGKIWAESEEGKGSHFNFELYLPVGKNPFDDDEENELVSGESKVVVVE